MNDLTLALALVPEAPHHVIPRGMLLHGKAQILGSMARGSFGIYDAERSTFALLGAPRPEDVLPTPTPRVLMAVSEGFEPRAWPMFQWQTLDVLTLEGGRRQRKRCLPPGVERLPSAFRTRDVDEGLRFALEVGRPLGPVYAVREGGRVVAAACCFWRSEDYFDISIDTLPDHRRRGLGRAVATALIEDLEPAHAVHCSSIEETLARQFIESLGFRRVGAIHRGIPVGGA